MGVFDNIADTTNELFVEGQQIALEFLPGVPNVGQATIQWNLPARFATDDGPGAYSGIVVIVSRVPVDGTNIPRDGIVYTPDPTVDPDKFAGDRIGHAIVVGATYEAAIIAAGQTPTTSIIINDIQPNVAYYVCGYMHDAQNRYFQGGSRAYSDMLGSKNELGTPAVQVVLLNATQNGTGAGVLPTDGTGLVPNTNNPTNQWQFELIVDSGFPDARHTINNMIIDINGNTAGTYQQLLSQINRQIAIKSCNAIQSPVAPGTGEYYWNGTALFQWNGLTLVLVTGVIIQATDPTAVATGQYWYNPTTDVLKQWNGTAWITIAIVITSDQDPNALSSDGTYWFNGTNVFSRCGNAWCEETLYNQTIDPSCPLVPTPCSFWLDTANTVLYGRDINNVSWVQQSAVSWPVAPNAVVNGTFWYDETTDLMYVRASSAWVLAPFVNSTTDPSLVMANIGTSVIANSLWYNPTTEVLNQRTSDNTAWAVVPVLIWPSDPTDVLSCELWLDDTTTPGVLYKWDIVHSSWDLVSPFYVQATDPYLTPVIPVNAFWYDSLTGVLSIWNGSSWTVVTFINYPTDPTVLTVNEVWYDPITNKWQVWNGTAWVVFTPIVSTSDPTMLPTGTLWFDTTNNVLYQRVGSTWQAIPYVTSPPTFRKGSQWFNSVSGGLFQWNGTAWVPSCPSVIASFDTCGNLRFQTTFEGSNAIIMVPVPTTAPQQCGGCVCYGTGHADFTDGYSEYECHDTRRRRRYTSKFISNSVWLFSNLVAPGRVLRPIPGQDGVSGQPTYSTLGVGTDGSPSERRNIMSMIRTQLGYPTVQVELDNTQLDRAVQNALETFRQRSSMTQRRAAFFLDIRPFEQHYKLTNKAVGFNKIVQVMAGYRFTSAFLATNMGAGVYGQIVLQHLYNMGTFDLLSYHLVSSYVEQLEIMFATRLVFTWDEQNRELSFYNSFTRPERVLLDVTIEKTEQEIFSDRYAKRWVQQFALAEAMDILAQIRGKYSTLPGAGGGVTLNASDLTQKANDIREMLYQELDDLITVDVETYGAYGSVCIMG